MKKTWLLGIFIFLISFVYASDCIVPYGGMVINQSTTFCEGDYYVGIGYTPQKIEVSGENIVLDCNNSVLHFGRGNWDACGIRVNQSFNVTIKNCFIKDSQELGGSICINNGFNTSIENNHFSYVESGINLNNVNGTIIRNNTLENIPYEGITSVNSNNNLIKNNLFQGPTVYPITINSNENTIILNNIINSCTEDGIVLFNPDSNYLINNSISNCITVSNSGAAIYIYSYISVSNNYISGNKIYNNTEGIFIYNTPIEILNNEVYSNYIGIRPQYNPQTNIYHNNVYNNTYDLYNWRSDTIAEYNWWGTNNKEEVLDNFYLFEGNLDYFPILCMPYPTGIISDNNGICILDQDNDGVLDKDDKCPNTLGKQIVYGCNCEQILAFKPGNNNGELKKGCSKGTIEVFTNQIGWAKDLF